jgi:peroxiredoxin
MKYAILFALTSALQTLICFSATAQSVVQTQPGGIRQTRRIDENTKIVDKATGKQVSFQEYIRLRKTDENGYHLEPVFDEYGEVDSYKLRPTTAQERETHRFYDRDPALRPKVGEPMPEFVMKGIDDKVYQLKELKGHVIVLSFWISLRKPFWGPNQAKAFADALRPYRSETDPISLGILQESREDIVDVMASETLPFVAIPNSYGFHQKFHVTTGPCFIVIDRAGKVAAYLEGSDYEQLRKVLEKVSR